MTEPVHAVRIPETMGPQEIGPYIRSLREHFNLTPQDVSERLHIRVRYVSAIEEGRFEAMPGKVYARGYVHTYAEFLGLDADQVVAQCFPALSAAASAAEVAPVAAPAPMPKPKSVVSDFSPKPPPLMRDTQARSNRLPLVLGGVAVLAVLGYTQLSGSEKAPMAEGGTVAEVPEALLASVRSTVMPRAQNYGCLTGNLLLTCFYEGETLTALRLLEVTGDAARPALQGIDFGALETDTPAEAPPATESDVHD